MLFKRRYGVFFIEKKYQLILGLDSALKRQSDVQANFPIVLDYS